MTVFDGHNDTLTSLYKSGRGINSFFEKNDTGHIDLPRAVEGNFLGGFFSIFTPTPKDSPEAEDTFGFEVTDSGYKQSLRSPINKRYAQGFTDAVLNLLREIEAISKGKARLTKTYRDLKENIAKKNISVVLHFEGAEVIEENLSNLSSYYDQGLRALGLVWSRPNSFGHGVPFQFPNDPNIGPGLTAAGKDLVKECNRLGILIDLSHINLQGFLDVAQLSNAPLVVTHADVFNLCPSTRNLTNDQIDLIGKTGGVIGINFEPIGTSFDPSLLSKVPYEQILQQTKRVPLSEIVKHISYVVERIGIDHVAFGSDFDGADVPEELKDVTGLPKLIAELEIAGYNSEAINKITYKNWLRVIKATWKN